MVPDFVAVNVPVAAGAASQRMSARVRNGPWTFAVIVVVRPSGRPLMRTRSRTARPASTAEGNAVVEMEIVARVDTCVAVADTRWLADAASRCPLRAEAPAVGRKMRGRGASIETPSPVVGLNVNFATPLASVRTLAGRPAVPDPSSSITTPGTALPSAEMIPAVPDAELPALRPPGTARSRRYGPWKRAASR